MTFKLTKRDVLHTAKNFFLVILGTSLLAFGTAIFVLPFELVVGGLSGIALVLNQLIPVEALTPEIWIAILNWGLFFLGLFILGKSFALKTLLSTFFYPLAITLFSHLVSPDVLDGFFNLASSTHGDIVLLIAAIMGGVCIGSGCALTFLGGGSTGGVDILAFILCKFFRRWKSSVVLFLIDATVITSGMFISRDLTLSLLGIFSAFVSAIMVDKVFLGNSKSFIAQIITDKPDEINKAIIEELERTATVLTGRGAYSGEKKQVILLSFKIDQYAQVFTIINRIDKNAFVTVEQAHEISGEGWTK